jgi:hypothetical protein
VVAVGSGVSVVVAVERIVGGATTTVDVVEEGGGEVQPTITVNISKIVDIALRGFTHTMLIEAQIIFKFFCIVLREYGSKL